MSEFDFTTTGFEFKGFKGLYRAIEHLPETVKKDALEPILVNALEPMAEFARVMAPDDPGTNPPYDLKSSIVASSLQRSGRARFASDPNFYRGLGQYDARAYMGPTKFGYPQAVFAEFGTTNRKWKPPGATKSTGFMAPRPYMRPAWDSQKQVALKLISDHLAERLTMIARLHGPKG